MFKMMTTRHSKRKEEDKNQQVIYDTVLAVDVHHDRSRKDFMGFSNPETFNELDKYLQQKRI